MHSEGIKIAVADEHPIFLDGLSAILNDQLNFQLVGRAAHGLELIRIHHEHKPDIILTGISMPILDGIEAIKRIRKYDTKVRILCFLKEQHQGLIYECKFAGANGYILKSASSHSVLRAISKVQDERPFFYMNGQQDDLDVPEFCTHNENSVKILTKREFEIITLLCKDYSTRQIAEAFNISIRTIEHHKLHIFRKLMVKNVTGVLIYAIKHNLIRH